MWFSMYGQWKYLWICWIAIAAQLTVIVNKSIWIEDLVMFSLFCTGLHSLQVLKRLMFLQIKSLYKQNNTNKNTHCDVMIIILWSITGPAFPRHSVFTTHHNIFNTRVESCWWSYKENNTVLRFVYSVYSHTLVIY